MANRLPTPGSDNGTWGDILNAYLSVSLASDGSLNSGVVGHSQLDSATRTTIDSVAGKYVKPPGGIPLSDLSASGAPTGSTYLRGDNTWSSPPTAANATNSATGLIQLSGDLAGSATSPTVAKINGISLPGSAPSGSGQVLTSTSTSAVAWSTPAPGAQDFTATSVKTGAYSAAAGDFVPVDTTSASVTITLPTTPADKSRVGVKHVIQGGTNTVSIATGSPDVFNKTGGPASATLTLLNQGVILQYAASSGIWYVQADDLPLSQTDLRYVQQSKLGVFSVDSYGAVGDGTTDDATAIASAITAAASFAATAGNTAIVDFNAKHIYLLNSGGGLSVPQNLNGKIWFRGNWATIKLSSGAQQFLNCVYAADYDTFRNIRVNQFRLDRQNVSPTAIGHVIFGNYVAGTQGQRLSYDSITIEDIEVVNLPTQSTDKLIWMTSVQLASNEATQNTITNILIQRVKGSGGRAGIVISSQSSGFSAPSINVWLDNITVRDFTWDSGAVPSGALSSSGVQIGGPGGRCLVENCAVKWSGDVGYEIDSIQRATLRKCHAEDSWNCGYTTNNYFNVPYPQDQRLTHEDCTYARYSLNRGNGFRCGVGGDGVTTAAQVGPLVYVRCRSLYDGSTNGNLALGAATGGFVFLSQPISVSLRDCQDVIQNFNHNVAGTKACSSVQIQLGSTPAANRCDLIIRNFKVRWNGARGASGGALSIIGVSMSAALTSTVDIDGLQLDAVASGTALASGSIEGVALSGGTIQAATIKGLKVLATSGDAGPKPIFIGASGAVTLSAPVWIDDCDFTQMTAGGTEISVGDSTNTLLTRVGRGIRWKNAKTAATITPGTSPYDYQNADIYPERVVVRSGTVSKIELSVDGSTYDDTGVIAGTFWLDQGDHIRVTYSVAPTMRKVPAK